MPIHIKQLSEVFGKDVFTDKGLYCGKIADIRVNVSKFRLDSFLIEVAKESFLSKQIGAKKGIIVPFQALQSIGDILLIRHIELPEKPEEKPKV